MSVEKDDETQRDLAKKRFVIQKRLIQS